MFRVEGLGVVGWKASGPFSRRRFPNMRHHAAMSLETNRGVYKVNSPRFPHKSVNLIRDPDKNTFSDAVNNRKTHRFAS